jgi:hypothetical protein
MKIIKTWFKTEIEFSIQELLSIAIDFQPSTTHISILNWIVKILKANGTNN